MENLIEALLTDENGISEQAYEALVEFVQGEMSIDYIEREALLYRLKCADATDGRFYFPS
jgi:hypothetical protein